MLFSRNLFLFLMITVPSAFAGNLRNEARTTETISLFREWTDSHQKSYDSAEEALERLNIWLENNERIEAHNNQVPAPSFFLGHNEFSDLTQDEFAKMHNLGAYSNAEFGKSQAQIALGQNVAARSARQLVSDDPPPQLVNWVSQGAVTPVKNQGACGSCWAFSTTGALEGAKFIKTGELVALSEQNLLDCDHTDLGCNGGLMDNAFKFDEKSGGLCSEEDYPYQARQGDVCNPMGCEDVPGSIVSTFYDVPPGDADAMMAAIAMQPISIAIQADQFVFQFYKNGVLTDDSCGKEGNIDHGVLAVGFDTDSETGEPFWLVKNSWGDSWGENGYIRMSRNSENEFGMCAILKMASYPEVE